MAGIMLAMQGVSLENSSVTVLNIYTNVRFEIGIIKELEM
jgi:hypothetical protein